MSDTKMVPIGCGCQRDGHTYIVTFWDYDSLLFGHKIIGKWASDPKLSFTWFDCVCLSEQLYKYRKAFQ